MPLGEPDMPGPFMSYSRKARVEDFISIINWCAVEKSPRYKRTKTSTWCNIYATDVCYLADYYLPHVFWTAKALTDIRSGKPVVAKYGVTITELSANSLYEWLVVWGGSYGWILATTPAEAQEAVNRGGVAVVCAKKPKGIGHISVVIPETITKQGHYVDDVLVLPVQSQAGAKNYAAYTTEMGAWWKRPGYIGGIWYQKYEPRCAACGGSGVEP